MIVGIMEDMRYTTIEDDPTPMFFLPMAQGPGWGWRTLFVRLKGEPSAAIAAVRRTLSRIEPGLPHVQAQLPRLGGITRKRSGRGLQELHQAVAAEQ